MSSDPSDSSSKVDLERRRVPLERKISLKFKEFRGFITEYSQNLSMGGMFIRTSSPKPVGTIFDFELSLTDDFKLVQGIGEVIWVREVDAGPEKPSGMGVRFLDLSSESRRLIQRIVEEQIAHGGTPFELEPQGFPPPPLKSSAQGAGRQTGQSALFHPTAAPVSPAPPPARPAPRPPSAPPVLIPATPTAAPRPAAPTPPARAESPPPAPPVPAQSAGSGDVLPDLDDSWEGEALEGFSLEDAPEVEFPLAPVVDDPHEDATLLRPSRAAVPKHSPLAPSPWVSAPEAPSAAAPAIAPGPGGFPRGRGLPSGFDEVARAFAPEPGRAVEPDGETVRLAARPAPPEAARPLVMPRPAPPSPPPPTFGRPAPPSLAPHRQPPRRRSSALPLVVGLLLALVAAAAAIYLGFPELLPAWARGPEPPAVEVPTPVVVQSLPAGGPPSPDTGPVAGPAAGDGMPGGPAPAATGSRASATAPPLQVPGGARTAPTARAAAATRFTSIEEIWGQRSAAGTMITIVTNGQVPVDGFSTFRLEGPNPREVVRLRGVDDSYRRSSVPVSTVEVKQVRLGYHAGSGGNGNELHVVIDLASSRVKLLRATPVDNRLEILLVSQ